MRGDSPYDNEVPRYDPEPDWDRPTRAEAERDAADDDDSPPRCRCTHGNPMEGCTCGFEQWADSAAPAELAGQVRAR